MLSFSLLSLLFTIIMSNNNIITGVGVNIIVITDVVSVAIVNIVSDIIIVIIIIVIS